VGDAKRQRFRAALMSGDRLLAHIAVRPVGTQESWEWVQPLLARSGVTERERRQLLSGLADVAVPTDRIVCSCHAVGAAAIDQAIARHGLTSVGQVGNLLKAGTQCGSCLPELRKMLGTAQRIKAAV
jgi:assimilatory nitrate reductase catalytic subunit